MDKQEDRLFHFRESDITVRSMIEMLGRLAGFWPVYFQFAYAFI